MIACRTSSGVLLVTVLAAVDARVFLAVVPVVFLAAARFVVALPLGLFTRLTSGGDINDQLYN